MALRMYRTTAVGNAATAQTSTAFSPIKTATDRSLDLKTLNAGAGIAITDDAAGNLTIAAGGTGGALVGATVSGSILGADIHRSSAAVTANANTTYANVTGLTQTVVAGTYKFRCVLPSTVASGTGGIKYAFNYTTTVLTSIEATATGFAVAASATQHTTTATSQADLFSQAAVVLLTVIEGTMIVSTGGTIDIQMAQSVSNASNTVTLVGASMQFDRIA